MNEKNISPNQKAWMRFKKSKTALIGLFWISLICITAILGYIITPDKTPNCSEQMLRIALKNPGFSTDVLLVENDKKIVEKNFFSKILFGKENQYKPYPIIHYTQEADTIQATLYNKDSLSFIISNFNPKNNIKKRTYLLGTDKYGRDILSRMILGARISLLVGFIAVFISLFVGVSLGAVAAYVGGRVDQLILFLINTVWSIPTLLLVFAIVFAFGKTISIIFIAVGLTMWVDVARIVRGQVLATKQMQYVEAAYTMGIPHWRIILKHILPNILGPIMVIAAANFATAILLEAGLSYLGYGVQSPVPSWGGMLNENYGYAISGKPLLALIPAFAIMMLVLSFNWVGNGLRDALDVKSKE